MVASHSSGLTVKSASTTKTDSAMACPLVLTGSMAAVATAAICRLINSLSDKLLGFISSPDRVLVRCGEVTCRSCFRGLKERGQGQKRRLGQAQYNTGVALVQVALAEDSHATVAITPSTVAGQGRLQDWTRQQFLGLVALAFLPRSDACTKS
jgi:hypothetical protein